MPRFSRRAATTAGFTICNSRAITAKTCRSPNSPESPKSPRHETLATFLLLAVSALGQAPSGAIKATVTVLADGVQRNVIVNPETHLQEETLVDKKGKVMSKTIYALDERNLPTTATFYDAKGAQLYKAAYQRDGSDRITEETFTSTAGKSLGRRVYGYGPTGQADRFKVTRVEVYDANGNLVAAPQKPASPGRPDKKKKR